MVINWRKDIIRRIPERLRYLLCMSTIIIFTRQALSDDSEAYYDVSSNDDANIKIYLFQIAFKTFTEDPNIQYLSALSC